MNEETRKKYEAIKENNQKHVKEKFVLEHVLFQECLSAIKEYTTIDEDRMAEIWNFDRIDLLKPVKVDEWTGTYSDYWQSLQ